MIAVTDRFRISQEPVLVWGTGTLTQFLLANTVFADYNIVAFIDSNIHYHDKKLSDKAIISPDGIQAEEYRNMPIIVSTYAHSEQIKNAIENELRLNNEIIIL
jgi:hypothetical protein